MKHLFLTLFGLLMFASATAQSDDEAAAAAETSAHGAKDLTLLAGVDFDMVFDNREYAGSDIGYSQTIFGSRLTPLVGLSWGGDKNRLMLGMDFRSDYGDKTNIFAEIRPQLYYRFDNGRTAAYAGIFPRDRMLGEYGEHFISDSMRFYDNLVQGVMGQHRGERGFIELSVDWCGLKSEVSREKFRIMSAGQLYFDRGKRFYGGYAFSLLHYANSMIIKANVVDHMMIDPYVGARFNAWLDFDIKLHFLQSIQHDRSYERFFRKPRGGMLQVHLSKWGIFIDEQLYLGENLMPLYSWSNNKNFPNGYGGDYYAGERFFGTDKHVYNNLKVGYDRFFFNGTLGVKCYMAFQYEGTGLVTKQFVQLSVRLLKDIPLQRRVK